MASSQWDHSPPKFTEFGPLSSDVKPSGNFLTRLLRRSKEDVGTVTPPTGSLTSSREPSLDRTDSQNSLTSSGKFNITVPPVPWDFMGADMESLSGESEVSQGQGSAQSDQKRTLTNVLSQISNILERRSATPQTYKDSDFKQYWMPDSSCRECYDCGDKFTTFRRRHHCRICGQIFCSKCCNQELPGKVMGYRGNLRVCTYCCRVVLSCMQQSGLTGELKLSREDLGSLPQIDNVDGDSGSYQEFGWWTPILMRRRSLIREESRLSMRSSSTPDLVRATTSGNPFDFNPHMGLPSAESIQIERKLLVQDSQQLKILWRHLQDPERGIQLQSHRVRLRMYTNCLVGSDIISWLEENKSASREQATAIGQALLDAQFIEPISAQEPYPVFHGDWTLYKPGEAALSLEMSPVKEDQSFLNARDESMEPLWVQEIDSNEDEVSISEENKFTPLSTKADVTDGHADGQADKHSIDTSSRSTFYVSQTSSSGEIKSSPSTVRVPRQSSSVTDEPFPQQDSSTTGLSDDFLDGTLFSRTQTMQSPGEMFTCPPGWRSLDQLRNENGERLAFTRLQKSHEEHRVGLVKQLLSQSNLSLTWTNLLLQILNKVTEYVRPDVRTEGDNMDIRKYVQIKKIPGGQKQSTALYHGVVCTKNIAHKKMTPAHTNPKILLLKGSIEYQRVENKFSSLEPQILQEREFLRMSVDKVAGVKPDVVIVEKSVSRLAQEFLLEQGITLCFNVKPSVMERVARFTQADIVTSIDGLVSRPTLGLCHTFKVKTFHLTNGEEKTLMFFDGCATHLGCTITLRGGPTNELKRVKKILQFMTLAAYHSCLEISFLMDEFALPPPAPDELSLPLDGLDITTDTEDGRQPIFSPRSNLSSAAMFQMEVASELMAKSDPMAESFLARVAQSTPEKHSGTNKSVSSDDSSIQEEITPVPSCQSVSSKSAETFHESNVEISVTSVAVSQDQVLKDSRSSADSSSATSTPHENKENISPRLALKDIPKRKSAEITELKDFSDPLHNYQKSKDESIFVSSVELTEQKLKRSHQFRKAVDGTMLSFSPYFKLDLPYLETEAGSKCELRKYFPEQVYWSKLLDSDSAVIPANKNRSSADLEAVVRHVAKHNVEILPAHPLILTQLSNPASDKNVQTLLSDFRARGGRIKVLTNNHVNAPPLKESSNKGGTSEESKDTPVAAAWERRIDCLEPTNHQRLGVLFSSYSYVSANAPYPCVSPWVVMMDFYGKNDITLGGFLERFCFRETYTCPSEGCDTPMVDHIRRFVHETGCIYVILRKLENLIPGGQSNILMWSWCRRCKQVTPVVPMSVDTWSMSFAKYLEIRFHGLPYRRRASAEPCTHTLHHDHYQYFGFMGTVASFKYSPISLREIFLPPPIVSIQNHRYKVKYMVDNTKQLAHRGSEVYNAIFEHMVKLKSEVQHETQMKIISDYMCSQQTERGELRELAQSILHALEASCSTTDQGVESHPEAGKAKEPSQIPPEGPAEKSLLKCEIADNILRLKRLVAEAVIKWNAKIQDFIQQQRKLEKTKSQSSTSSKKDSDNSSESVSVSKPDSGELSGSVSSPLSVPSSLASISSVGEPNVDEVLSAGDINRPKVTRTDTDQSDDSVFAHSSLDSYTYGVSPGISAGIWPCLEAPPDVVYSSSYVLVAPEPKTPFEVVSAHSEHPVATHSDSSDPKGFTKSDSEAVGSTSSEPHSQKEGADLSVKVHKRQGSGQGSSQGLKKDGKSFDEVDAPPKQERKGSSVKWSLISNLLSGPGFVPVVMPFPPDEHHTLPPVQGPPVVVYDREPSSIIAYSLSCHDYHNHLLDIQTLLLRGLQNPSPYNARRGMLSSYSKSMDNSSSLSEETGKLTGGRVLSFFRGGQSSKEKSPKLSKKSDSVMDSVKYTPRIDKDSIEAMLDEPPGSMPPVATETERSKSNKNTLNFHIELQFSDNTSRFYCRVYFAEQFRQLRKQIFPAGEEMFIRSISRCVAWKAKGGKSGSAFCKTRDDRFILKQMSDVEVESFEKFAPNYFIYMTEAHAKQKPTALAKILGVYRIGFRNNQTNAAMKQDLLVMENLFYDRKITQTFDLKGSVRNRLVNTTGKSEDELVLLDENLLKASVDQPLYIRQHSKAVLTEAINRDTQFLATNLVMDYSLLVGLDDSKKELVVGIIDYIRTFTWDKKLEMVVKYTGIFGGQGKMPTVVSPELYKSRFLEAMDRYFLLVPDRWTGLGVDSENIL